MLGIKTRKKGYTSMIAFIAGLLLGSMIGVAFMAIYNVSSKSDENAKRMAEQKMQEERLRQNEKDGKD